MRRIIEHYGQEKQLVKTIEESGEFVQAIAKYINSPTAHHLACIKEEMADLLIMLEQTAIILNIKKSEIELTKEYKLERTFEQIRNSNI